MNENLNLNEDLNRVFKLYFNNFILFYLILPYRFKVKFD